MKNEKLKRYQEENQISVKYINYGIACRIGNRIYINQKLMKYPKLYEKILQHELDHSSGYDRNDVLMDLHNKHLFDIKDQYYSFILKHPSSWIEFLPGWFYEGRFVLAPTTSILWGLGIVLFGLIWRFLL